MPGALAAAFLSAAMADPGPIRWGTDETRASAESERSGRPLLVDAWADWCAGCKLLDRNTWSDPRVRQEVLARYVPLRIDLSGESPETQERMQALGVTALPAVLVCARSGCEATARRIVGYVGPQEMLEFLRRPAPPTTGRR